MATDLKQEASLSVRLARAGATTPQGAEELPPDDRSSVAAFQAGSASETRLLLRASFVAKRETPCRTRFRRFRGTASFFTRLRGYHAPSAELLDRCSRPGKPDGERALLFFAGSLVVVVPPGQARTETEQLPRNNPSYITLPYFRETGPGDPAYYRDFSRKNAPQRYPSGRKKAEPYQHRDITRCSGQDGTKPSLDKNFSRSTCFK